MGVSDMSSQQRDTSPIPQRVEDAMARRGNPEAMFGSDDRTESPTYKDGGMRGVDREFSPDSIVGYLARHGDELAQLREQVQTLIESIDVIMLPELQGGEKNVPQDRPPVSHIADLINDHTSSVRYMQQMIDSARRRIQL